MKFQWVPLEPKKQANNGKKGKRNEELSGQISSLEAEEASLRDKNSEVERDPAD